MTPRIPASDAAPGPADRRTTAHRPAPAEARQSDDRSIALWLTMAVLGLAGFAAFTVLLLNHWTPPFDQPLLDTAKQWQSLAPLWRIISESANIPLIVIGVGLVLFLFFTKRRREAVIVALILIAVTAGSEAVKQLVHRDRPSGTDPNIPGVVYSFPSGHVLEALTIFGILAIRAIRSHISQILRVLIVLAVVVDADLVAVARVALAAHWPSDTIASFLGAIGVLGVYGLLTHRDPDRSPGRASTTGDTGQATQNHA